MKTYKKYNIQLPKYEGIQRICQANDINYINNCGYCMFYNYIGIKYVVDKVNTGYKKDITQLIQSITDLDSENKKKLYNIFIIDSQMGPTTYNIIKNIF